MPKIADLLGIVGSTFTIGSRSLTAGLRRIAVRSGSFLGAIDWTITANRTIVLPDDSVTLLGDDRPIGLLNAGVSLRGYEPIITVTATKTLAMADSGTIQNCTNAAAAIVTIPLNSAVAFPIGTRIIVRKTTAQTVTIAQTTGVTVLNSMGATLTVTGVTSATILRKTGTDTWIAFPDLPETAIGGALRTAVSSTSARTSLELQALVPTTAGLALRVQGANYATTYALSIQSNSAESWLEILNNGGTNKGSFFGMSGNAFQQYNWQGGDITFSTALTASASSHVWSFRNNSHTVFPGGLALKFYLPGTRPAAASVPYGTMIMIFDTASTPTLFVAYTDGTSWFNLKGI